MTRRIAAGATTAATALLLCGAAAPAAHAQSSDRGATTVALGAPALKALKQQSVTVTAVKPAKLAKGALALPIARGALGARSSWLEHDGGVAFRRRAGGRTLKVTFSDLRATLGSASTVSASSNGVRVSLFTVAKRRAAVNTGASTATLSATKVTLTTKAAALLRKRLKLRKAPTRALGTVAVDAALRGRQATPTTGTVTGPGATTTPGAATKPPPASAGCGSVSNQPISRPEPTPLGRPVTATTVTATVTWHVRPTFINYIATGDGASDGTIASEGATELPPSTPTAASDSYAYAAAASWMDVPSGQLSLGSTGKVNFQFPAHCIDFDAKSPLIELTPTSRRAIFTMAGRGGTPIPERKYVLLDLEPVTPSTAPDGTVTYSRMKAHLAEGADSEVFGGLYTPRVEFGAITVSYKP